MVNVEQGQNGGSKEPSFYVEEQVRKQKEAK